MFYLPLDTIMYHVFIVITKIDYMVYFLPVPFFNLCCLLLLLILLALKISASNFVCRAWRSLLSMLCVLFVLLFKASNSSLKECCVVDDVLGVNWEELSQVCCMFNYNMNIFEEVCFLTFLFRHLLTRM